MPYTLATKTILKNGKLSSISSLPFPMIPTSISIWNGDQNLHCTVYLDWHTDEKTFLWGSFTHLFASFSFIPCRQCNQRKYECYHYPNNPSSDCLAFTSSCIKLFNASKNSKPSRILNYPIYSMMMAWPETLIFFR